MLNYNHAWFLPQALRAVLDQSYRPLEIIIMDDGSTDNSVEIIEKFAEKDPVIRLIRNQQNCGIFSCINRLLDIAAAEYLFSTAADDKILPGFFEKSMNLLAQYPQAGLCSTLTGVMNEKGEYKGLFHTPIISRTACFLPPEKALAMLRRYGSWFMGNTAVYRRAALIEAGGLIPELGHYCDGFIELVLALKYGACFIPEPLAIWRRMEGTYSERVSANLDIGLDIMRHAERLMRSTYRDLFPEDYMDDWKREMLFGLGVSFVTSSQRAQIDGLRRLMPSPTLADRAFFTGLRSFMGINQLINKLYLFARFRRAHLWRVLKRKLNFLSRARIALIASDIICRSKKSVRSLKW